LRIAYSLATSLTVSKSGLETTEECPRRQHLDSEGLLQFEQVRVASDNEFRPGSQSAIRRSTRKRPRPRWHRAQPESLPGVPVPGQQFSASFPFGGQDEGFHFRRGWVTLFFMKTLKFTAIIEGDQDGYYAYCPELKGCQTQGDTIDAAMSNLREAAELYVETLSPEEVDALAAGSKTILSTSLEVSHA